MTPTPAPDAAAKDAAAQLKRILALIPRIADGDQHSLGEMAGMLAVDRQTVMRDLESIAQRFDEPGGFVEGLQILIESTRVSVHTNHFLRPMRLTIPELHALDLGLAMLSVERPPDERPTIEAARNRVQTLVAKLHDEELTDSGYVGSATSPAASDRLPAIRQGLSTRQKLRIQYQRGDSASVSTRTVCPYRLVFASGTWYLVAHCDGNDAIRVFRVDRIQGIEVLAETYAMPDVAMVAERLEDGRAFLSETPVTLRVRYSPSVARWIQEREGGTIEDDGSLIVAHPLADPDWAVRHVLQYGAEAEILEPASVRAAMRDRLEAMVRLG